MQRKCYALHTVSTNDRFFFENRFRKTLVARTRVQSVRATCTFTVGSMQRFMFRDRVCTFRHPWRNVCLFFMLFYSWLVRKWCEFLGNYSWLVREITRKFFDNYSLLVRKWREILGNYSWLVRKSCEIWPYLAVSGCICLHLAVSGRIRLYLAVFGRISPYLAVSGCSWLHLAVSYLAVSGCSWPHLTVSGRTWVGCIWPYLAVPGRI